MYIKNIDINKPIYNGSSLKKIITNLPKTFSANEKNNIF